MFLQQPNGKNSERVHSFPRYYPFPPVCLMTQRSQRSIEVLEPPTYLLELCEICFLILNYNINFTLFITKRKTAITKEHTAAGTIRSKWQKGHRTTFRQKDMLSAGMRSNKVEVGVAHLPQTDLQSPG